MTIQIEPEIAEKLPHLILGGLTFDITVVPSSPELLKRIDDELSIIGQGHTEETIREVPTVKANKDAYRLLGKDPNRYRPAAESLLRRVAKGKGIYQINNAVDILNLISVKTGYSICGYDFDSLIGDVSLGIGEPEEPYIGIGRGDINIENLPVFRDSLSAFGTPTSDSVRTLISARTKRILLIFIAFDDKNRLNSTLNETVELYRIFGDAKLTNRFIIKAKSNG